MVPLGLGQAILGGRRNTFSEGNSQYQSKIYHEKVHTNKHNDSDVISNN